MSEELKSKLKELGLDDEQIGKLEAEGVESDSDMVRLSVDQIKAVTGLPLMRVIRLLDSLVPTPVVVVPTISAPVEDVIPEGSAPTQSQVASFAGQMGIDPSMLTMFMFANMGAGAGMDMDMSSFLPIGQIVGSYNPKLRNMPFMIMGQVERRLETPIVVINADGSVNPDLTVKYVMSLEEGFDPAEDNVYYDDLGVPYEVIRVGVDAQSIYDADPLDSSRALQKNGMGIGRINWHGVNLDIHQVVYFATRTHEASVTDESKLAWLREHIKPGVTRMTLRGEFPKALSEYNEAARTGSLPTLRVQLSRTPRRPEMMPRRRSGNPRDLSNLPARGPVNVVGDGYRD